MDIRDRFMVLCLTLLDRVLDFFTWGIWSELRGKEQPAVRVKE